MFYIYFLHSKKANKYYVGHSEDPWRRFKQHQENSGDKFTGSYNDWELVAVFKVSHTRGGADKIERFIKKQKSRTFIEKILAPEFIGKGPLASLVRVPHLRD
jgi:putative endonuclease